MGWSFGKSIRVIGNFLRLNISARGIGFSIGIRGARVSHGPRGTQVNVGRHGFRYRKTLAKTPERPQPQPGLAEAPAMGQPLHRAIDIDLLDATKPTESIENTNRLLSAARNRIVQESKPVWIAAAVKECSRLTEFDNEGEKRLESAREVLRTAEDAESKANAAARIEHIRQLRYRLQDCRAALTNKIEELTIRQ